MEATVAVGADAVWGGAADTSAIWQGSPMGVKLGLPPG